MTWQEDQDSYWPTPQPVGEIFETWDAWLARLKARGSLEKGTDSLDAGGGASDNSRLKAPFSHGGGAILLSSEPGGVRVGDGKTPEECQGLLHTMEMGNKFACTNGTHTSGGAECEKVHLHDESVVTQGGVREPDSGSDSDVLIKAGTHKTGTRTKWAKEEDAILTAFVGGSPETTDWEGAARVLLHKRSAHKCRHRWRTALDPQLALRKWTPEEEERLQALHQQHGNRWAILAGKMPGRSQAAIKAHWKQIPTATKAAMAPKPAVPAVPATPVLCTMKKLETSGFESGPPPEQAQAPLAVQPSPAEDVLPRVATGPVTPTEELRFESVWAQSLAAEWVRDRPDTPEPLPSDPLVRSESAGFPSPHGQGGTPNPETSPRHGACDIPFFGAAGSGNPDAGSCDRWKEAGQIPKPLSPLNPTSQVLLSQLEDPHPLGFGRVTPKPATLRRSLSVLVAPRSESSPVRRTTSYNEPPPGYAVPRGKSLIAPIRSVSHGMQSPFLAASAEHAVGTSGFCPGMTSALPDSLAGGPGEQTGAAGKRKRAPEGCKRRFSAARTGMSNGLVRTESLTPPMSNFPLGGSAPCAMSPPQADETAAASNGANLCALLSDHIQSLVEEQGTDLQLGWENPADLTPPKVLKLQQQHHQMRSAVHLLRSLIGGAAAGGQIAGGASLLEAPGIGDWPFPPESSGSETRDLSPSRVNTPGTSLRKPRLDEGLRAETCQITLEGLLGTRTGAGEQQTAHVPLDGGERNPLYSAMAGARARTPFPGRFGEGETPEGTNPGTDFWVRERLHLGAQTQNSTSAIPYESVNPGARNYSPTSVIAQLERAYSHSSEQVGTQMESRDSMEVVRNAPEASGADVMMTTFRGTEVLGEEIYQRGWDGVLGLPGGELPGADEWQQLLSDE